MSDSDMEIDDDEIQSQSKQPIATEQSKLPITSSIKPTNSQNDYQSKDSCFSFGITQQQHNVSGNIRFPAPIGINEPEQKRAAHLCKFFAKGKCHKGNTCRFLHVNGISNTPQQQSVNNNNMARISGIQSLEERIAMEIKEGIRASLLSQNGLNSLGNPHGFPLRFPQNYGVDVSENRSLFMNNSNPFPMRSSFVNEYRKPDMVSSSQPPWTASLFTSSVSVPMNGYTLGNIEDRTSNSIYGSVSGSLPPIPQETILPVSSNQEPEPGPEPEDNNENTSSSSDKKKRDWEPSEAFQPSFTIPPYILPSSDALYDPFTDIENNSNNQEEEKSLSPQLRRDSNNDDKNSSCSQSQQQHQETIARMVEGVATSVVDQNDATSKDVSSSAAAPAAVEINNKNNKVGLKRSKPTLHHHESWKRSDGSSQVDGEVRSDAGTKVMRHFRTAVVEQIKDMLKPLWQKGRLSKEVHNMIVKRASEKIVSAAVKFHQVPTESESVEQYLSMSGPKIVKLVEGYVDKYGKS